MKPAHFVLSFAIAVIAAALAYSQQASPTTRHAQPVVTWEYAAEAGTDVSVRQEFLDEMAKDPENPEAVKATKSMIEMEKEYDAQRLSILNRRGREGWEFVGVTTKPTGSVGPISLTSVTFYFKRPRG